MVCNALIGTLLLSPMLVYHIKISVVYNISINVNVCINVGLLIKRASKSAGISVTRNLFQMMQYV